MRDHERLILEFPQYSENMVAFLRRLEDDLRLQRLFARNPSEVLRTFVFPEAEQLPVTEVNKANRLLFSLLTNKRFMEWGQRYADEFARIARERFPDASVSQALLSEAAERDPVSVYQEVIDASVRFVDRELIASLIAVNPDDVGHVMTRLKPEQNAGPSLPSSGPREGIVFVVLLVLLLVVAVYTVGPFDGLEHDGAHAGLEGLNRADLLRTSAVMMELMTTRAEELRVQGVLAAADSAMKGKSL